MRKNGRRQLERVFSTGTEFLDGGSCCRRFDGVWILKDGTKIAHPAVWWATAATCQGRSGGASQEPRNRRNPKSIEEVQL
jgi:hypothetical protein